METRNAHSTTQALASLLSLETVRKYVPLSRRKLYQLATSGELLTCRIGRRVFVSTDELNRFVAAHTAGESR